MKSQAHIKIEQLRVDYERLNAHCADLSRQHHEALDDVEAAKHDIERLQAAASAEANEVERLRKAIEDHQTAVCDNPQAAGIFADELLWAVLEPVPQPAPQSESVK